MHVSMWGEGAEPHREVPQSWLWAWSKRWPHTTHLIDCRRLSYAGYSLGISRKL